MSNITGLLHNKIEAAGIPIFGVSIGDANDRMTWRVDFRPEATAQQQADAQAIINAFVIETPAMQYVRLHYTHRIAFAKALYALDTGLSSYTPGGDATAQATALRTALTNAGQVIARLPSVFTSQFAKLRELQGVGGNIATMTLANLQRLEIVARNWLNSRLASGVLAESDLE